MAKICFPRDFIINLPPPPNYIGPSQIFGFVPDEDPETRKGPGLPIIRVINDYHNKIPDSHSKDFVSKRISGIVERGNKNIHNFLCCQKIPGRNNMS